MQIYDGLMLAIMLGAILLGYFKGLAWQVASVGSLVLSYFVSYQFRDQVAMHIQAAEPWNKFAAMLLLFLGTMLAVWIAFRFVRSFIEKVKLKEFDHHAGALVGALKGAIICLVVTLFALTLLTQEQKRAIASSHSGRIMAQVIEQLQPIVPEEAHGALAKLREELENPSGDNSPTGGAADGTGRLTEDLLRIGGDYLRQQPAEPASGAGQGGSSLPFSFDTFFGAAGTGTGASPPPPSSAPFTTPPVTSSGPSAWPVTSPPPAAPGSTGVRSSDDLRREIDDFFRRQDELSRQGR